MFSELLTSHVHSKLIGICTGKREDELPIRLLRSLDTVYSSHLKIDHEALRISYHVYQIPSRCQQAVRLRRLCLHCHQLRGEGLHIEVASLEALKLGRSEICPR